MTVTCDPTSSRDTHGTAILSSLLTLTGSNSSVREVEMGPGVLPALALPAGPRGSAPALDPAADLLPTDGSHTAGPSPPGALFPRDMAGR